MLNYTRAKFSGVTRESNDAVLIPLLEVLEKSDHPPTHCGETTELRNPYDRRAVLEHSATLYGTERRGQPCVQRVKRPRYTVLWTASRDGGWGVDILLYPTAAEEDFAYIARLVESVTVAVEFDFGVINFVNDHTLQSFLPGVGVHVAHFQEYGITCAAPWTYIGSRVADMVGEKEFEDSLGTRTGWVKVSPEPWNEEFVTLRTKVERVNEQLDRLGLRARTAPPGYALPGTRWKSLC